MLAPEFQRARHLEQPELGDARGRPDVHHARQVPCQRPGLVEGDEAHQGESLQGRPSLDHRAHPTRGSDGGHRGDRHRQCERAGGGRHQHDQGARHPDAGIAEEAAEDRDGDCEHEDARNQRTSDAVGQSLAPALAFLGLLHDPDHPGEGAVGGAGRDLDLERAGTVDGPRQDRTTRPDLDADRLAGDRRQVKRARAMTDHAVGREAFAGSEQQPVAEGEIAWLDDRLDTGAQHGDAGWDKRQQGAQSALRAPHRVTLQPFGDREQERERRSLGDLAKQQRADHRDGHQHADAQPTSGQRGDGIGDEGQTAEHQCPSEQGHLERHRPVGPLDEEPAQEQQAGRGREPGRQAHLRLGGRFRVDLRLHRSRLVVIHRSLASAAVGPARPSPRR